MDNVLRRLIEEKVINHAQMMSARINKLMNDVVNGSEVYEAMENYRKAYHSVGATFLQDYSNFEAYKADTLKKVKVISDTHQELLSLFKDGRTNIHKFLEESDPEHYVKVLDGLLAKSEEINGIVEHGKTVSDFKKLDGFRDKIDRFATVSNKNKCYRNGKFNEEAFIKGCATYMWLKNEDFFTKLFSYYFLEEKKLEQTKERVLNAFYNYYKDNPDLLKVD